ncbi:MAG TPA: YbdK family carboxylate-amine ligase [Aquihabitans sp.]|nr:YbdK family carboxylate-amine ligase [Aquihabitans sp.]
MSAPPVEVAPDEHALDARAVRAAFDANEALTVGLEEEVLLVDPATYEPVPAAERVVAAAGGDERVKLELPACQVELLTRPHRHVADAVAELAGARRALLDAAAGLGVPAAAAVHPTAPPVSAVTASERGRALHEEYREVAGRQLVGALQVHVAVGTADATLAVYNALRGHLPELAALAAAAPFHEGRDTGLASVRPVISGQLPRQGVPPAIASWDAFVADLAWGRTSGTVCEPRRWWWELRPHVVHGTLEVRVPDVQPTVAATTAVAGVVHALVCHLAERHHEGRDLGCPATWRIAENRWAALRDGVHGRLADLETGESVPTERRLHRLLDEVEAHAPGGLDDARRLVARNTADELRAAGLGGATAWLASVFAP